MSNLQKYLIYSERKSDDKSFSVIYNRQNSHSDERIYTIKKVYRKIRLNRPDPLPLLIPVSSALEDSSSGLVCLSLIYEVIWPSQIKHGF